MSNQSQLPPQRPELDFSEESSTQKLARKSKDSPLMTIGLASFAAIAAYGIYKFRNKGKLSASNYLMQLRVTAQGAVIGCLTISVIKSLYDHYTKKESSE